MPLKEKLMIEANKLVFSHNSLFTIYSEEVILRIAKIIYEYKSYPEEIIIEKNSTSDPAIYFIESGQIEIFLE